MSNSRDALLGAGFAAPALMPLILTFTGAADAHSQRVDSDAGVSLLEWILILAAVFVIAGLVVATLRTRITDAANSLDLNPNF